MRELKIAYPIIYKGTRYIAGDTVLIDDRDTEAMKKHGTIIEKAEIVNKAEVVEKIDHPAVKRKPAKSKKER